MNGRRLDLGLRWEDVAKAASISDAALRAMRRDGSVPRELTQRGIERALGWEPGSVARVIGGGEPAVARAAAETPRGIPADAPKCSLEQSILAFGDDEVSPATKALIINRHRDTDPDHQTCRQLSGSATDRKLAGLQG